MIYSLKAIFRKRVNSYFSTIMVMALIAMLLSCATISKQSSLDKVKTDLISSWILEEWHIKGQAMRPPNVEGRFIVHDNIWEIILFNNAGSKKISVAGYGKYNLDASSLAMGWDKYSLFIESASGTKVSNKLPWEGMLSFPISVENNKSKLGPSETKSEIIIDGDTLTFMKEGKIVRIWSRASGK